MIEQFETRDKVDKQDAENSLSGRLHKDELKEQLREKLRQCKELIRQDSKQLSKENRRQLKEAGKEAQRCYKEFNKAGKEAQSTSEILRAEKKSNDSIEKIAALHKTLSQEHRACWLDRSSLSSGPQVLKETIESLHKAGINEIYFECDNGGYASYASAILPLNPDLEKYTAYDPLQSALETAHKYDIKVHAWVRNFSVCNRKLDDIFRAKYPHRQFPENGPVLSLHERATESNPYGDWALRLADGALPANTHDLFLDPANPQANAFAQSILLEIAAKYPDLDGIQYDYIRYPFKNEEMGLNQNNWHRFQTEYPRYKQIELPKSSKQMSASLNKDWNGFKVKQIDAFVRQSSRKMKLINPALTLSAAVFPLDLNKALRQEWKGWIENGWVSRINPMTYVPHDASARDLPFSKEFERKFREDLKEIKEANGGKAELAAGIAVSRANVQSIVSQMEISKELRLKGHTLFATSTLTKEKLAAISLRNSAQEFESFAVRLNSCWKHSKESRELKEQERVFLKQVARLNLEIQKNLNERQDQKSSAALLEGIELLHLHLSRFLEKNKSVNTVFVQEAMECLEKCRRQTYCF